MLKVNKSFLVMFIFIILVLSCYTQAYTALLGSTGNAGRTLISIDTTTGAGTAIAPHGAFGNVTEIEARSDGVLFGATNNGNIITINPITGVETLIGNTGVGAANSMEFVGSTLYASIYPGGCCSLLATIDQNTGAASIIAPFLINGVTQTFVNGMAYDQATSTMYIGRFLSAVTALATVDLSTGFVTLIGGGMGVGYVSAMDFDSIGILYGGISKFSGTPGSLVTINTTTGIATVVGPTSFPAISGLTFLDITDTDGDTMIDLVDTDDDNDGVLDGNDIDPLNPDICEDVDADTCDDCSVGTDDFGPLADNDPFNDGLDVSGDGICNAGLPIPAVNNWGMIIFLVLAGLGAIYFLRRKRITG